jgi:hypothetical protein
MKAYVIEYGLRLENPQTIEVVYGNDPDTRSRYETFQEAEATCRNLNLFEVRVGQHQCAFSVDSLPGGDFGVFCICHPQCQRARCSAF